MLIIIEENKSFERQRTCRPYFKKQRQQIVIMIIINMLMIVIVIVIMMIVVNDLCEGNRKIVWKAKRSVC